MPATSPSPPINTPGANSSGVCWFRTVRTHNTGGMSSAATAPHAPKAKVRQIAPPRDARRVQGEVAHGRQQGECYRRERVGEQYGPKLRRSAANAAARHESRNIDEQVP